MKQLIRINSQPPYVERKSSILLRSFWPNERPRLMANKLCPQRNTLEAVALYEYNCNEADFAMIAAFVEYPKALHYGSKGVMWLDAEEFNQVQQMLNERAGLCL